MNKKSLFLKNIIALACTLLASVTATANELDEIIEGLRNTYDVQHISNADFRRFAQEDVIVFDVRKQKEFDVSHMNGAIQLDPGTNAEEFFAKYGEQIKGKNAVFYCSVGLRSSIMLSKIQDRLTQSGATGYNLEGGVFKWHNDNMSLTKNGEITRKIHPYNIYWGRLVNDKPSITYK